MPATLGRLQFSSLYSRKETLTSRWHGCEHFAIMRRAVTAKLAHPGPALEKDVVQPVQASRSCWEAVATSASIPTRASRPRCAVSSLLSAGSEAANADKLLVEDEVKGHLLQLPKVCQG